MRDALNAGHSQPRTISLLVEKDEMFATLGLSYSGGARYPRLERDTATPDLLTTINTPRTQ